MLRKGLLDDDKGEHDWVTSLPPSSRVCFIATSSLVSAIAPDVLTDLDWSLRASTELAFTWAVVRMQKEDTVRMLSLTGEKDNRTAAVKDSVTIN